MRVNTRHINSTRGTNCALIFALKLIVISRYYYYHPQSQLLTLCRRHIMIRGDVGVERSQLLDSEDHGDVVKMTLMISSQKA